VTNEQTNVAKEVAELSASGKIHFGEVVGRLMKAGIERYHADYSRMENTYYTPDGGSTVVSMGHGRTGIAGQFSAAGVDPEFTRQAQAAGCVGYFVQITGMCVQYFGRNGEIHTEWFPGAQKK
jgi:uncharacterized protein YbcV (DUF1398 family)